MIKSTDYGLVTFSVGDFCCGFPDTLPEKYYKQIHDAIREAYWKGYNKKLKEVQDVLEIRREE